MRLDGLPPRPGTLPHGLKDGCSWLTVAGLSQGSMAAIVLTGAALLVPAYCAEGLAMAWLIGWAGAPASTILAMRERQ